MYAKISARGELKPSRAPVDPEVVAKRAAAKSAASKA